MAKKTTMGIAALTIDVAPALAEAGSEVTIAARATCNPPCDLTGDLVAIRDADGQHLTDLTFTDFDEESATSSGSVTLRVPEVVGDYAWTAVLEAFTADDLSFDAVTVPVSVVVKSHTIRVNIWDAPSAIGLGERFAIKVGAKCNCGCSLAGQPFTVNDAAGGEIAKGTLGNDIWPATDALYFANADLVAPPEEALGNHTWSIQFPASGLELPHAPSTAQFGVTFVPPAEHVVTVEAVDVAKLTPLAGAIVTMHPYRAVADDSGIARLKVPKGEYTLFVSARRYTSDMTTVAVTSDLRTQARLAVEVRRERV